MKKAKLDLFPTRSFASLTVAFGLVLTVAACGNGKTGSGGDGDGANAVRKISSAPVSGVVQSKAFSLGAAIARKINTTKGDEYLITMVPEGSTLDCGVGAYPETYIVAAAPTMTGTYVMDINQQGANGTYESSVSFVDNKGQINLFLASYSRVRIDAITTTELSGGIYAETSREQDSNSRVTGEFLATICQ